MSTRSNIIRENEDGSFDSIYCHWDGYPENNGRILYEHYQDLAKLAELLALGDLSSLDISIGGKHDFDSCPKGVCNFYGRDRGETGTEVRHYADLDALAAMLKESWTEWVYVWKVREGKWYYTNNPSPTWFKLCGKQREMEELTPKAWAEATAEA